MRRAVLALAFDHLGAEAAITSAWHDNTASLGVSRSLGYRDNGVSSLARDDGVDTLVHLRMTRADWQAAGGAPDVTVTGLGRRPAAVRRLTLGTLTEVARRLRQHDRRSGRRRHRRAAPG